VARGDEAAAAPAAPVAAAGPPSTPAVEPRGVPAACPDTARGRLPPLFLVAGGMGGEQELLVTRADAVPDPEQPFYGLRARGVTMPCRATRASGRWPPNT
jgi:hypothetical protein